MSDSHSQLERLGETYGGRNTATLHNIEAIHIELKEMNLRKAYLLRGWAFSYERMKYEPIN